MKRVLLLLPLVTILGVASTCRVINVSWDDTLNVRIKPTVYSQKIGELAPDLRGMELLYCKRGWCKIKYVNYSSVVIGWVRSKYISCNSAKNYCVTNIRWNDTLNVRIKPTLYSQKIGELAPDARGLKKLRCITKPSGSRWCRIKYSTNGVVLKGWVNARYITPCE